MQTVTQTLERANTIYHTSVQKKALAEQAQALRALLAQGWLNERNRENAEALLWRVQAKELALAYFTEGYNEDDYAALAAYCAEKQPEAEQKGYGNTAQLLERLGAFAARAHAVMADAAAEAARVRTYDWQSATSSEEECREVAALFAGKEKAAEALAEDGRALFGAAAFPSAGEEMAAELAKVRTFAENRAAQLHGKDAEAFFAENARSLSDPYAAYEFFPARSAEERAPAGVIVLCTPFADEAELFACKNAAGQAYALRAAAFAGRSDEEIEAVFSLCEGKGADLLLCGAERCRESTDAVFRAALRAGRAGRKVFVLDTSGRRSLYDAALKAGKNSGFSALDVSFVYLSMPLFEETALLFEENGMLGEGGREEVRKGMPFLGFVGLNRAVQAFAQHKDWISAAKAHSAENAPLAAPYLAALPTQGLLLDEGWGSFSEDAEDDTRRAFDYDDIRAVDPKNIRRIVESGLTVFETCGAIVRYCTLAGEDSSVWPTLDAAVQSARLTEATKLIMRALGVPLVPEVEVLDELETKGAGGLCCDGGKRVQYRRDCIKDYAWTVDAVCHECYHAFQHTVMYGPWKEWYWTELGVTKGRKAEWLVNTGGKYFSSVGSPSYLVQVRESDARAFAKDCLRDADKVWHTIDFA